MIRIWKRLRAFYIHDLKIRYKMIVSHFLLILIPMILISLLFYNQLFGIIEENVKTSNQHTMLQTGSYVEYVIGQLYNSSDTILNDKTIAMLFGMPDTSIELYLQQSRAERENIVSLLHSVQNMIDGTVITGISIYVDGPYAFLHDDPQFAPYDIFSPMDTIVSAKWYDIVQPADATGSRPDYLVCPMSYLTAEEKNSKGTFSLVRPIFAGGAETPSAYLALYFSKDHIENFLLGTINEPDSVAYLINRDNYLVAASDYGLAGSLFVKHNALGSLPDAQGGWQPVPFGRSTAFVSYQAITGSDWFLISILRSEAITGKKREMLIYFITVYLLVAGITYIGAMLLSQSLTKRISLLKEQLATVESGHPAPLQGNAGKDEVGALIDTYNYMSTELHNLMEEKIRIVSDLNAAELKSLQSQINPHFLYNTLDMINWLSKKGRAQDVSAAIQNLSKFYKMTLGKGNLIVTVADEVEHTGLYVSLQNMRYNNSIRLIVDIPDEILEYRIPKIILQPLVENAIQHGIICKPSREGHIVINGWPEGDDLILSVSDDGVGMDAQTVHRVFSGSWNSGAGSSIGILNTHKRLQLFFGGERYGLTCRSEPGQGTDIQIRIPIRRHTQDTNPEAPL